MSGVRIGQIVDLGCRARCVIQSRRMYSALIVLLRGREKVESGIGLLSLWLGDTTHSLLGYVYVGVMAWVGLEVARRTARNPCFWETGAWVR